MSDEKLLAHEAHFQANKVAKTGAAAATATVNVFWNVISQVCSCTSVYKHPRSCGRAIQDSTLAGGNIPYAPFSYTSCQNMTCHQ